MEKKTALYDRHEELGARISPFAGFVMPIRYSSVRREHMAVRDNVGVFDLSHMGEFRVRGTEAREFLDHILSNDAEVEVGQAFYSTMCYPDGGIVDDLITYRLDTQEYLMVVNASNIDKDWAWVESHMKPFDVRVTNESYDTSLIAIQGPAAQEVAARVTDLDLDSLGYYHQRTGGFAGTEALVARTGYTGEDGFEVYLPNEAAPKAWDSVMEAGSDVGDGIAPVGLGARDSLRLEMGYALYGNDIDHTTSPVEARLSWVLKLKTDKDFIGREVIARQKRDKPGRYLVGMEVRGKGFARPGTEIYSEDRKVGTVTSGMLGPAVGHGVCLAYLERGYHKRGLELEADIRGKRVPVVRVRLPFYKDGSRK
jgi:aminomethyltransferase